MRTNRRWAAPIVLGLLALGASGCGDWTGTHDPHHPGVDLGTFHVLATLATSTCGPGALGSTADWAFDVKLSRGEAALFWDNGAELIPGSLANDGVTFHFESGVVVDMRAGQGGALPPCSIRRTDKAEGTLDSPDAIVSAFAGALSYTFTEEPGPLSDCSDVVSGAMPSLAALPCSMAYELKATQSAPPSGGAAALGADRSASEERPQD